MSKIEEAIERSRKELLDMGLQNNTLLDLKASKKSVDVIHERGPTIAKILLEDLEEMDFLPREAEDGTIDLETKSLELRHCDLHLQTDLSESDLSRRLKDIARHAKTHIEDHGFNTLHLAIGFVRWKDKESSNTFKRAPLILVPVSMTRKSAMNSYAIQYDEVELVTNKTLSSKLKGEFEISLPDLEGFIEQSDGSSEYLEERLAAYFSEVRQALGSRPGWVIEEDEVSLGFFSFRTFQMYQDLDLTAWKAVMDVNAHPVMKGLLGDGFEVEEEPREGDPAFELAQGRLDLTTLSLVKDSDSSQTEAIVAAKTGKHLVVQGPPGTGKSQTITNMIAQLLGDGKSVLFVAEKSAALEVVKRRLDQCHLGDAVLELHSHKGKKSDFYRELKRTFENGAPSVPDRTRELEQHREKHQRLQDYCAAVRESVGNSEITYPEILGYGIQLRQESDVEALRLAAPKFEEWDRDTFLKAQEGISSLADYIDKNGCKSRSVFRDSNLEAMSPAAQEGLPGNARLLGRTVLELVEKTAAVVDKTGLSEPKTIEELSPMLEAVRMLERAPNLEGVKVQSRQWIEQAETIGNLLRVGSEIAKIKEARKTALVPTVWEQDVLATRDAWNTIGRKWYRFLSGRFRRAKKKLGSLVKGELPSSSDECVKLLDDVTRVQEKEETYKAISTLGPSLFGPMWMDLHSDWLALAKIATWCKDAQEKSASGSVSPEVLDVSASYQPGRISDALLEELEALAPKVSESLLNWNRLLEVGPGSSSVETMILRTCVEDLEALAENAGQLTDVMVYNRAVADLRALGLDEVPPIAFDWKGDGRSLVVAFLRQYYDHLQNFQFERSKALREFEGQSHEELICEFRALDQRLFEFAQERLAKELYERIPRARAGTMATLSKEMHKKSRQLPVRKILGECGDVIQRIKPVFMMSPMSVATYLSPGKMSFDVVIFDEASQVRVVDGFGALMRARQAVVVGDTKQMPPTAFFGKSVELDEEEEALSETANIESILSMFLQKGACERMLRWHYRSRHESLIAFSNHQFYGGNLMIFPSASERSERAGVSLRLNRDHAYGVNNSSTNPGQAREIAEFVMDFARTRSDETLGVVAFSVSQAKAIEQQLEALRKNSPDCESFFAEDRDESFFVKNLENVQGDERSTIVISVGYGYNAEGRLRSNFGPLNNQGGERRLNVLITRAREQMVVFSNFSAADLSTSESSPLGVVALKGFLGFAETGELPKSEASGREMDSPFEEDVKGVLESMGYSVQPQVGSAGFFIDLAVRDPRKPGRFVAAVECDGASYHSSRSARDRDRIRQAVLEGLGWKFHRIWSTDWFRNRSKETARLKARLEELCHAAKLEDEQKERDQLAREAGEKVLKAAAELGKKVEPKDESKMFRVARAVQSSDISISIPYKSADQLRLRSVADISEVSEQAMALAVNTVVDVEGPIHVDMLTRRIGEKLGFSRIGVKIKRAILSGVDRSVGRRAVQKKGDFVYPKDGAKIVVRSRANLETKFRKMQWIAEDEIELSMKELVSSCGSIHRSEIVVEVAKLLGVGKASATKLESELQSSVDKLVGQGVIADVNGLLKPVG